MEHLGIWPKYDSKNANVENFDLLQNVHFYETCALVKDIDNAHNIVMRSALG